MTVRSHWIPPLELPPEPPPPARETMTAPPPVLMAAPAHERPAHHGEAPDEHPFTPGEGGETLSGRRDGRLWPWIFWPVALLGTGIALEEMLRFLLHQYRLHPALGGFFALLLALLCGALLMAATRELMALRALDRRERLREEARAMMAEDSFGRAHRLLDRVTALYRGRPPMREAIEAYRSRVRDHLGDRELLELYSDQAMRPLDEAALGVIGRQAAAAALLAVISPLALLDALLFLWRNLRMIREISRIYGVRPGLTGSWRVTRALLEGMTAAGAGELVSQSATEALGDALAGAALAGAGQAATSALFTARTGLQAMHHCRPIPFPSGRKPGLGEVRKALKRALRPRNHPPTFSPT